MTKGLGDVGDEFDPKAWDKVVEKYRYDIKELLPDFELIPDEPKRYITRDERSYAPGFWRLT